MRVVLIYNPRSGRGLSKRLARQLVAAIHKRGHAVKSLTVGGEESVDHCKLADADAFIVIGGDGSVRYQIEAACAANTPIYHAGTGNENLFAKHFRMRRTPAAVVRAVEMQNRARVDIGQISGWGAALAEGKGRSEPVLLMVGTGIEASVIRRFASARNQDHKRTIGHLAYFKPVLREALHPTIKPVNVWIDGEQRIERGFGQLLIANCSQYAVRTNPARRARMSDGLLDVVFMPSRTSVKSLAWLCAARLRVAERVPGWVGMRGREVRVEWAQGSDGPGPIQIDGEWAKGLEEANRREGASNGFTVRIEEKVLPVLLPG